MSADRTRLPTGTIATAAVLQQRIGPFSRVSFMREIHPENQAVDRAVGYDEDKGDKYDGTKYGTGGGIGGDLKLGHV
jgi:hypothetical protein